MLRVRIPLEAYWLSGLTGFGSHAASCQQVMGPRMGASRHRNGGASTVSTHYNPPTSTFFWFGFPKRSARGVIKKRKVSCFEENCEKFIMEA
jgi:hypothetical protein